MQNMTENILASLATLRMPAMPEEFDIHAAVEKAFDSANIEYIHEARLGPGCRIDFLCGDVGIEIKKGKPRSPVIYKQVARYLSFDSVNTMIVVLQRPCLLPGSINGKPVICVALNRLWGVALP